MTEKDSTSISGLEAPQRRLGFPIIPVLAAIAAMAAPIALLAAARWIGGPVIAGDTLESIQGKTRADVRRILGDPTRIQSQGTWIYGRSVNPGWVEINFDDDGQIGSINDEQVDPVTFGSGSWQRPDD